MSTATPEPLPQEDGRDLTVPQPIQFRKPSRTPTAASGDSPAGQTPTQAKAPRASHNATQKLMRIAQDRVLPMRATGGSLMAAKKDTPHLVYPLTGFVGIG